MFNDPNLAVMSAVGLGPKDVAIGISVSGSTKSTAGALKAAKTAGAYTIAMTNHIRSPLTSIPDAVLAASSTEDPRARGIFTSILGQFMIVDILATLISRSNPKFEITLRETAEAATDASY
jgi:DNA-binding MurR/RpiR family transcriptional regulator